MSSNKFKIESGVQLLARLTKKPDLENFHINLFKDGLKHGDIIDISSTVNTSDLLTDIIIAALLPDEPTKEKVGVLMFNTNINNYKKLICTLDKKISVRNLSENANMPQASLESILSNFFVLEIYDATQLYTSIHSLDTIFARHPNISLIVIDSLTAFYWSEQGMKITKMDLYIKNLLRMIKKVTKDYKVVLVYTRPRYFGSNKDCDNLEPCDTDSANIKVQLSEGNSKRHYQVNIKTLNAYYEKYFIVNNLSQINWQ